MTIPLGNSEFSFPSTSMLKVSGKQNSLFPSRPVIKCLLIDTIKWVGRHLGNYWLTVKWVSIKCWQSDFDWGVVDCWSRFQLSVYRLSCRWSVHWVSFEGIDRHSITVALSAHDPSKDKFQLLIESFLCAIVLYVIPLCHGLRVPLANTSQRRVFTLNPPLTSVQKFDIIKTTHQWGFFPTDGPWDFYLYLKLPLVL